MRWSLIPFALAAALAASASAGGDHGPEVAYLLVMPDGRAPRSEDVRRAVDVIDRRLNRAGVADVAITPSGDRITVAFPSAVASQLDSLCALIERPGTIEFRIEAEPAFAREHSKAGGPAPDGFAWISIRAGGEMLVQTPEAPLAAAVDRLRRAGVDARSDEFAAAREKLDGVLRDEVFTGDQIAKAEVQRSSSSFVVYFALRPDRMDAFAAFTERHVGQPVAIVLDGRVESAPVIRSKLPGEGIIEGGGAAGFTKAEATALAVVLSSGPIAGKLVRVTGDASRLLSFSVDWWPGDVSPPAAESLAAKKAAADVLVKRCAHAGLDGVTASVGPNGIGVEVRIPAALAASEAVVRRLAERRGAFEFRVRAEEGFEQEHRERRSEGAKPPNGYEWVEDEHDGLRALVEMPEIVPAAKVQELVKKGAAPDDAGLRAAMADLLKAQTESVFTNADVASAVVERKISTYGAYTRLRIAVRFEFKEARKAAFEKFTGEHVGRSLAVVLDGKVHVCPVIKSAIPGEGQWIGPGNGYTDEEAQELAALLACGPLPCRLVAEKDK